MGATSRPVDAIMWWVDHECLGAANHIAAIQADQRVGLRPGGDLRDMATGTFSAFLPASRLRDFLPYIQAFLQRRLCRRSN